MTCLNLQDIPTCDLVNELAKREGVINYSVDSGTPYDVVIGRPDGSEPMPYGPARILVVVD
jgi:hypothetical protein